MPSDLLVLGLSHHAAPIALRERLAADEQRTRDDLRHMLGAAGLTEAVLLSTCNRVELVGTTREPARTREQVLSLWSERGAPDAVAPYIYEHRGLGAVRHLFRVASGLDSMVIGEPQILGQVKQAFALASEFGSVGNLLGRCFDRTFQVAKRVRSETEIAAGNVSVSSIACELAERIFSDLSERMVLLVGAGKMSEAAARSLTARGAQLRVVNRNPERAAKLAAACGGEARPLEALATELAEADVVISSTAKDGFMITYELMLGVVKMRKWRQLFVIDIAVPRDVDPRVESLRNVFLYDMDDLKRVSHANLAARERAAQAAETIVDEEVAQYERWLARLELTPTIVALRNQVRALVQREKEKALPRLGPLDARAEQAIDALCEGIVNQILHRPLTELKRGSEGGDGSELVETVQRLFGLSVDDTQTANATRGEAEMAKAAGRARRS